LDRSQLQQRFQADLLGGRSSQAFLAKEGAANPMLTYSTKARAVLTTAGARIGLAQTLLVVDEMGTYRATQEYRVENRTEPFLEVELPEGSQMWTVQVAGERVKPALAPSVAGSSSRLQRVRIPLIKTAEGDLDYPVVIKYGGEIAPPTWFSRIRFPLIHTLNINVELSQVRLRLPESYDWFNFDGTLGRVETESELQAGWLAYRTRQLTELSQLLGSKSNSASDYTKARAINNLSELQSTIEQNSLYFSQQATVSEEFRKQFSSNSAALQSAQQQAIQVQQGQTAEARGNRDLLNDLYGTQSNGRSFNALGELGLNFATPYDVADETISKAETVTQQNAWLSQNKLDSKPAYDSARLQTEDKFQVAKPQSQPQSQMPQADLSRPLARSSVANATPNAGKKSGLPPSPQGSESQAARYGRRLQDQNVNRSSPPSQPTGGMGYAMGGMGGMGMGADAAGMGGPGGQLPPVTPAAPGQAAANQAINQGDQVNAALQDPLSGAAPSDQPQAAFMASLDVELPVRGREYFFTTPRGEVELSAQGVSNKIYQRVYTILAVLAIAAIAWAVYLLSSRLSQTRLGTTVTAIALALFGVYSLLQGYLPTYGLLALLAAAALAANRFELRHENTRGAYNSR